MHDKKIIIKGIVINYLHLLLAFLSNFILTPIILRYIGKSAYGVWAIFSSIMTYFLLFDLGMNTSVAKYTSEYNAINQRKRLNSLISSILTIFVFIACLIILVSIIVAPFVSQLFKIPTELISASKITFVLMSVNIALMLVGGVFGNIIYGFQRVDVWKTFTIVQLAANAFFVLLFLKLGFNLSGVAAASVLGTTVLFLLYIVFIFYKSHYGIILHLGSIEKETIKEVAPFSIRTFLLGLSSRILYYTSNIIIGIFLGAAMVTSFDIAYKLCFLSTYVFSVISTTFFPHFSKLYALADIDRLRTLYLKIVKSSLAIITPVAVFFFFWGHSFIDVWVGKGNFVGMKVFLVLVSMLFFHALGTPSVMLLQSTGKNELLTYSEIINAVLNLVLSVILIKKLGVFGVALAMIIAHICTSFWVAAFQCCKYTELSIRKYLFDGVLPPLVVGLVTWCLIRLSFERLFLARNLFSLVLNGLITVIVYVFVYALIGLNHSERVVVYNLFNLKEKSL